MSRSICVKPCIPAPKLQITIPGGGTIDPMPKFSAAVDCSGCENLASLMTQLGPFVQALSAPLCLLKCVQAIVNLVAGLPSLSGAAAVATDCLCVAGFTPLAWCSLVKNILQVVESSLDCFINLLNHLVTLKAQASAMQASTDAGVVRAGQCLDQLATSQQAHVMDKIGALEAFLVASSVLAGVAGAATEVTSITTQITGVISVGGGSLAPIVEALSTAKDAIHDILTLPGGFPC